MFLKVMPSSITFLALLLLSLFIPTSASASPIEATPLVIGETFLIPSKILNEQRRINVYLPPGYAENVKESVPVIYMPDGGMAEDFLHIAGLVEVLVNNGTMKPHLLVGIENTQRRRDMTGPTDNPEDKKIAPAVGGSAEFRAFIRDELMPEIARRYRISHDAAIVGESLAGLFVVETYVMEPDLFNTYIAIDPSLYWNNESLTKLLTRQAGQLSKVRTGTKPRLYLTSSGDGNARVIHHFVDVLKDETPAGASWHYESMPEEQHATIYHPAALKAFRFEFNLNNQ